MKRRLTVDASIASVFSSHRTASRQFLMTAVDVTLNFHGSGVDSGVNRSQPVISKM
jgi:hypothetical protein